MKPECLLTALALLVVAPAAIADTPYDDLEPGHWRVISSNTVDDVQPCPSNDCSYSAVEGVSGVINDWCGGALASGYGSLGGLVLWGGGHNGYFGSEVYVFDLASGLWVRASEPYDDGSESVAEACSEQGIYPDGSACPAHTYDRVDYHPPTNRFVIMSGTPDPVCGGCDDGYVHLFDLDDNAWTLGPEMEEMTPVTGAVSAYDSKRDVFWFLGAYYYPPLRRFDPNADGGQGAWTTHGEPVTPLEIDGGAVHDPVRDVLLYMDPLGSQKLYGFDLTAPDATSVELATTGDVEILGREKLGLEWDPSGQRVIAWYDGADVYVLEAPEGDWKTGTWTWTRWAPADTNTVVPERGQNGTYSRFRYVPSVNAFVVVSTTGGPVWMYKLDDVPGTGPNTGGQGGAGAGGADASGSGAGGPSGAGASNGAGAEAANGDDAANESGCACSLPGAAAAADPAMLAWCLLLLARRVRRTADAKPRQPTSSGNRR